MDAVRFFASRAKDTILVAARNLRSNCFFYFKFITRPGYVDIYTYIDIYVTRSGHGLIHNFGN